MEHEHYCQMSFSATSRIGKYKQNHRDRISPHPQPDRISHQHKERSRIAYKKLEKIIIEAISLTLHKNLR
jgi:hypothetical protein